MKVKIDRLAQVRHRHRSLTTENFIASHVSDPVAMGAIGSLA